MSVSSPVSYSTVPSPVHLAASASSGYPITGWQVYVDGTSVYGTGATNSINTYVNIAQGTHQIVFRAWDSTGAYDSYYDQVTVSGTTTISSGSGLPTPPSTAKVISNIDDMTGWSSCHDPGCAGGSGSGSYWMALYQQPSLDGASAEFFNSGVWANALWWKKFGANGWASNFLWDFYINVDSVSTWAGQALEFDLYQFIGGWVYMIGTQCDYGAGQWDTWDQYYGHWYHTGIACPKFTPGVWHHIQWYLQRVPNSHQYKYVTLVVDGKSYSVNITRNAKYLAWGDNLGVQYQLDVNASGGGYHMWVDKSKLTIW